MGYLNHDDTNDTEHLTPQGSSRPAAAEIRRLRRRAEHARLRGYQHLADDLVREAAALEAATFYYERAIADARAQVDDLRQTVARFWDDLADDRTLDDLADDACVVVAFWDALDRAESRLLTL